MSWVKVSELPEQLKGCVSNEHSPPGQVLTEPGIYEYQCPGCGWITRKRVLEQRTAQVAFADLNRTIRFQEGGIIGGTIDTTHWYGDNR